MTNQILETGSFSELRKYNQFIVWELGEIQEDGKKPKYPINYQTGRKHDPTDRKIWLDAETCATYATLWGPEFGIGFVFTKEDPFFFIDIDACLVNGEWSKESIDIIAMFNGAAIEISQSGQGFHLIGKGSVTTDRKIKVPKPLKLELYTQGRFVALTGEKAGGDSSTEHGPALTELVQKYLQKSTSTVSDETIEWTTAPNENSKPIKSDAKLIAKALNSKSGMSTFGGKASFKDLWECNEDALTNSYPSQSMHSSYDPSRADAALASHLSFWTGGNCERIKSLIFQSQLVRDKWEREDYIYNTILGAVQKQTKFYGGSDKATPNSTANNSEGSTAWIPLTIPQLREKFLGCVYVTSDDEILTTKGESLNQSRFNNSFGIGAYPLDEIGDKTTKKAWDAFHSVLISPRFPQADRSHFRPAEPSLSIIEMEGLTYVNSYVPIPIVMTKGDVSLFLDQLKLMLPVEHDQKILISYAAALVQNRGIKYAWAPVIQGCQGNGKSQFSKCVSYAIGRRHTHTINIEAVQKDGMKFNAWVGCNELALIQELRISKKDSLADSLKPLVADDSVEIQRKGQDQYTGDNLINFIMCTNHKDAVEVTDTSRRYCILYTAQQNFEDMVSSGYRFSSGESTDYFYKYREWLAMGGYGYIAEYLHSYDIEKKYHPAANGGCAPRSSSMGEAIENTRSKDAVIILEAIDSEEYGFTGGWICSIHLKSLMEQKGVPLATKKFPEVLSKLNYIKHPGLLNGRWDSRIKELNGARPYFYVSKNSELINLSGNSILKAFLEAQKR